MLGSSAAAESIARFETEIEFTELDTFRVTERIVYDFEKVRRHGIFRLIPVAYGRGRAADYNIALNIESVDSGNGAARGYKTSRRGPYLEVKIGDPRRKVSGVQPYHIKYSVERGLLYFEDHDELYWNVTSDEWPVSIGAASAIVWLPPNAPEVGVEGICFTGSRGSVERACRVERRGSMLRVETLEALGPRQGLTLVVSFPKGVLEQPSKFRRALSRIGDFLTSAFLLPIVAVSAMLELWRRRGQDPEGGAAIPVRYEPPDGMTPAEVGTLIDERAHLTDITATVLDLAVRGYLEIEELEKKGFFNLSTADYELRLLKGERSELRGHEQLVLLGLFESGATQVRVSDLKERFYTELPSIRTALYEHLTKQAKVFPTSPERIRSRWAWWGGAAAILGGILTFAAVSKNFFPAWPLSLAVSGGIVMGFAPLMPRKTRKGVLASQEILGLKEFIARADRDRLERMEGRTVGNFERILPYAIVLGQADQWAEAFADIYTEPPSWYHSNSYSSGFHPRSFVSDLGHSMQTMGNAMTSQPQSSSSGSGSSGFGGGGFSGGGFGGGGGGSW